MCVYVCISKTTFWIYHDREREDNLHARGRLRAIASTEKEMRTEELRDISNYARIRVYVSREKKEQSLENQRFRSELKKLLKALSKLN